MLYICVNKKKMFKYDLLTENKETFEIHNEGVVTIYNTDNLISLSDDIYNSNNPFQIGLMFDTNNIFKSQQGVYFTNGVKTNNVRMITVGFDNFIKSCEYFSARKFIGFTWKNEYSEFLKPNKDDERYGQYSLDSIVYSLFHSQNGVNSTDEFSNEFFWMSKDRMKELADDNGYDNLYNDARTASDRHVYKLLFGEERIYDRLSDDAKVVLNKATALVERSTEMRQVMANDDNHLDSWDAGYAQLKLVWKEYFPVEFKEFRQLYKNLEDRMRPLVYELGFLMK
jgi:hypothetical protein